MFTAETDYQRCPFSPFSSSFLVRVLWTCAVWKFSAFLASFFLSFLNVVRWKNQNKCSTLLTFSMIRMFEYFRLSMVCSASSFSSRLCCDWMRLLTKICYAIVKVYYRMTTHDIADKSSWHWFWLRFLRSNLSQSSSDKLSSCRKTFNFRRSASNNRKFTSNWTPNNWLLCKLFRISGVFFWLLLMLS